MSDYTPTTEEVSIGWAWYKSGWIHSDEIQPQFDRWLAEVKAQAWDEGQLSWYETGRGMPNPYRQGERSGNSNSQPTAETPIYLNKQGEDQ